ncbi:uncharacterized protein EAE98_009327 [Botrytis deweyae]|uniref:UBC core domain-containing protein n=1 Tax=Botrytis deweyae TaxID=2478750 RepID=A0ABQ7IBX2_9HELO|nr:uncharacterized protein EAE98_009327 [Botrytis deweyae]KAF7919487.1 hypothetical protein EAE98_009327 [Botrytis deweyae]
MAENPNVFEPWNDSEEEPGLNQQSKSTYTPTYTLASNPNPDTKTTVPCGEKLSKIRSRHKNRINRAIQVHFKHTPLSVLKFSREKAPYDRTRTLSLEYEAVHADDTTPYLSVCPASLYDSRVGAFGNIFDLTNGIACIEGPSESPYAGGIFFLHIYFPVQWPKRPMKVRFLTQIYHPNFSADEDFRLPSNTAEWLTENSLQNVLLTIFSLLSEPELDEDFIPEIAKEYIDDYNGFFEKAKLSTIEHASQTRLDVRKLVTDWIQDYVTFDYAVAACHKALMLWRKNTWEALPKDGSHEEVSLQCIIPDSAIATISQNLRRLCTSEIGLDELDLKEWCRRDMYLRDHSQSSLGNTLVVVWLKLQDEKRGIENDDYILPGAASNDIVEACQLMLRRWRDKVWEAYPEDTFKDRESVMPDSAIVTISNNLEKIGSGHIKLEHLDLWQWNYSTEFLAEDNEFCLRKFLQKLWDGHVKARDETTNTAAPEDGHSSRSEGPKSPRRLQLGLESEQKPSSIRWVGVRSGNIKSSRSKQEARVTKSEASTRVKKPKFKRNLKITREAPNAEASSSNSDRGAEIAEDGLDSETRSPNSNTGPQITSPDLDPIIRDLKSKVEELNLNLSILIDDLSSISEKANKRLKESSKGKGSQTIKSDLDPDMQDLKSEIEMSNFTLPISVDVIRSTAEELNITMSEDGLISFAEEFNSWFE